MRRPEPESSSAWPFVVCLLGGLVAVFLIRAYVFSPTTDIPRRSERPAERLPVTAVAREPASPAPVPILSPVTLVSVAPRTSPSPLSLASPTSLVGQRMRVAGTDQQGLVLYASPNTGRQPAGFIEGARVTLLGREGDWAQVRGDNRLEGWVLAAYLVPSD